MPDPKQIEEMDIREWFLRNPDLAEVIQTFYIVQGIVQGRQCSQPRRKTRSDAGTARKPAEPTLPGMSK